MTPGKVKEHFGHHECNAKMNPSAENEFVRVVPSNNVDPSSSCDRDYSCLSNNRWQLVRLQNWGQKFKISITQNRSAQNQLQSWSKLKPQLQSWVKLKLNCSNTAALTTSRVGARIITDQTN